ncbi:MAG: hypothetical protein IJ693_09880 [Bacteroidaceae bacterium]|nr:hypothetical protein [Bacteroidaceae bacterium]
MENRTLIKTAKLMSTLFMPLYAPMWVFLGLFLFSYLRMLPWGYKLFIVCMVYFFTVFVPTLGITAFRLFKKWTHLELSHREHRHMPYIVTLLSYATCLVIMTKINTAMFFRGIVMAGLISQIICITVNAWWKVSTHMVGMGGLVGALNAFSILFFYNPVWPFCALLLLSGALGTSRIILRQHSLAQVLVGFGIGYLCAMTFILLSWM